MHINPIRGDATIDLITYTRCKLRKGFTDENACGQPHLRRSREINIHHVLHQAAVRVVREDREGEGYEPPMLVDELSDYALSAQPFRQVVES